MTENVFLYDNKVSLNMPTEFVFVEDKEKYFAAGKPDFVYAEKDTGALISVTLTENDIDNAKIEERIMEYYEIYRRSVPNFSNSKIAKNKTKSGKEMAAFYYTSTAPNRDLYNFFILSSVDGKELTITMHCNAQNIPDYGVKFMHFLNSIDILD